VRVSERRGTAGINYAGDATAASLTADIFS
jgi:hypothetical protein